MKMETKNKRPVSVRKKTLEGAGGQQGIFVENLWWKKEFNQEEEVEMKDGKMFCMKPCQQQHWKLLIFNRNVCTVYGTVYRNLKVEL